MLANEFNIPLTEICKMPGVSDLKAKAKLYFAKALKFEAENKSKEAAEYLDKAVEAEAEKGV